MNLTHARHLFNATLTTASGAMTVVAAVQVGLTDLTTWSIGDTPIGFAMWRPHQLAALAMAYVGLTVAELGYRRLRRHLRADAQHDTGGTGVPFAVSVSAAVPDGGTFHVEDPFDRPARHGAASGEPGEGDR